MEHAASTPTVDLHEQIAAHERTIFTLDNEIGNKDSEIARLQAVLKQAQEFIEKVKAEEKPADQGPALNLQHAALAGLELHSRSYIRSLEAKAEAYDTLLARLDRICDEPNLTTTQIHTLELVYHRVQALHLASSWPAEERARIYILELVQILLGYAPEHEPDPGERANVVPIAAVVNGDEGKPVDLSHPTHNSDQPF
jgi:uncharacterized coiled-coil protein SlyX